MYVDSINDTHHVIQITIVIKQLINVILFAPQKPEYVIQFKWGFATLNIDEIEKLVSISSIEADYKAAVTAGGMRPAATVKALRLGLKYRKFKTYT